MMHSSLAAAAKAFPEELCEKIQSECEAKAKPDYTFGFRLSLCKSCRQIVSVPSVTIHRDPNQTAAYTAPCPDCGRETIQIDDLAQTKCPFCQEQALKEQTDGLWD